MSRRRVGAAFSARSPSRGFTLVELITALSILTIVLGVALRLLYAADRFLTPPGGSGAGTTALALALQDLGDDLRAAGSATGGGTELAVTGPGATRYAWDARRGGLVRLGQDNRFYPGVRPRFAVQGGLVQIRLTSGLQELRTAVGVGSR
jgi:prepilin-type N-terminal cleavage/methylation domain-containing protein